MKTGWEVKKLGEVCEIDKTQDIYQGLPYVGLEDIESNTGRFIGSLEPRVVKSSTFRFTSEHVLYGRLRPYLNKAFVSDFEGHCSTEIFPLRPDSNLANRYLLYWLLMDVTLQQIDATSTGARMPRADMGEVMTFDIPIPPLPEQERIVRVLDDAFADIATAAANAQANLQNARAVFQSYLNAVFSNRGEGWVEKKLGEVCITRSGGTPSKEIKQYYDGGEIPWIMSGEVCRRDITQASKFITQLGLKNSAAHIFPSDTVLVAMYGATAGQVGILRFEAATNQAVCGIYPGNQFMPEFLYYFFLAKKEYLVAQATGNAQPNISQVKIKNIDVPLLKRFEQECIVRVLDEMHTQIRHLESIYERKLAALEELKQSLLHRAFSGGL